MESKHKSSTPDVCKSNSPISKRKGRKPIHMRGSKGRNMTTAKVEVYASRTSYTENVIFTIVPSSSTAGNKKLLIRRDEFLEYATEKIGADV